MAPPLALIEMLPLAETQGVVPVIVGVIVMVTPVQGAAAVKVKDLLPVQPLLLFAVIVYAPAAKFANCPVD